MNMYGGHHDYSLYLFDLGATDPTLIESLALHPTRRHSLDENNKSRGSPPPNQHRHDGTSPLPLGMDWSPPPRIWEGRNSVWPHDFRTGWSYCVTVPSWTIIPKGRGLDPTVFYRVQVGIQSPEGSTTLRGILRRFSDFLKLYSDLKRAFPKKKLPPAPSKGLLRTKSKELIEERRCSLGDWIEKLLSDIDLSRSFPVAVFLELEAAARSSFYEANQSASDANSPATFFVPADQILNYSDGSLVTGSSFASDYGNDSSYKASELGTARHGMEIHHELGMGNASYEPEITSAAIASVEDGGFSVNNLRPSKKPIEGNEKGFHHNMTLIDKDTVTDHHMLKTGASQFIANNEDKMEPLSGTQNLSNARTLSGDSIESDASSVVLERPDGSGAAQIDVLLTSSGHDVSIVLPTEEQNKMNRILNTLKQRLNIARTDVEDLTARLSQELAVRQYLSTKVKDLETELETMKQTGEESLQQAIINERERVTQVQWDMEELRRKCIEMELKLKSEQEEKGLLETTKNSIVLDNDRLRQELDVAKEQVENLLKHHEESETKSKLDLKILAKEVKSLRNSQLELKQDLVRLANEKIEAERILQEERQRREHSNAANAKLLHECEVLRSRLEECSVNFLIEEEIKLSMDTSSPSEAIDILGTSDNRIGLLLAEAQLLAEDVENIVASASSSTAGRATRTRDDELRKMLTDVFIDNASLRTQINSILRYALDKSPDKSEKDAEETSSRESVLSKFLER
ncbi:PX domain-containing protein EREL2-like [Coffea eugenioides]|uniref:PX domain-containing protein EREL2-like n=1 Tax=Coffea eugenioides TaxID=49369 RepID=UPI000F60C95F|nr:PX domain-containing protein EREL2-like [Coffea eugenioides]